MGCFFTNVKIIVKNFVNIQKIKEGVNPGLLFFFVKAAI